MPSYRCRLEVHSVETACACAAEGLGVAIVPSLIARFFRSKAIEMRPFHPDKVADYGIITMPGLPLSFIGEAMATCIQTAVREP
ncbi:LysR substrate binding domain protein [compost metagenome]